VASKHVRDIPVLPRAANPAVPAALEAVIMKAMAKNPDDRYRSAEELRADLLRFAEGRPVEAGDPGVTSMMTAVGATQVVPASTGRTMAVPTDGSPPPASREDLERQKRTRRLVILLVVLLVALGIIAFFLLRSVIGGNVTVPNVVGGTQASATQTLKNDNLTVGTATFRTSSQARGIVLSSDPKAGASVSKNSAVDLVVSEGPNIPTVTVPPVTGKQLTAAISAIQGAGLTYKVDDVTSTEPVGTVINQSPPAGSKIKANVPVVLTVSNTQTSVSVPSVLGQSPASAGATLRGAGLSIGSQSSACSSQYGQGVVSSQTPGVGATEPPNTPVNLVVSTGNCATVPGVVGQSVGAAQTAISGAGLVANTTYDTTCANGAQPGNVDSQNPAASAQVASGSSVTISVCQPATTTTTTTTPTSTTTSTTTSTSTT
jgi:serine/threonine-protein kinase